MILGAIIGDIIGVPYEWHRIKTKDFPLFSDKSQPSDDSVLTVANMYWLLGHKLGYSMLYWCNKYPRAGYGGMFRKWLQESDITNPTKELCNLMKPYSSYGNGSAMRVSAVGWKANTLHDCITLATESAEITHNHSEGIKGARAIAVAIYLARKGKTKLEIKQTIEDMFKYNLDKPIDKIRPTYKFDSTCTGSVPQAIRCFLEGKSYEEVVRNAVSLGGDSDTLAAIAGSIAEAYYGIPDEIVNQAIKYIPEDMLEVIRSFSKKFENRIPRNKEEELPEPVVDETDQSIF